MGCIDSSLLQPGDVIIGGPYASIGECDNYCGICCIPGCESDFSQVNSETNNCTNSEIGPNDAGMGYASCNDYTSSPGYPYANSLMRVCDNLGYSNGTGYLVAGWCPANFVGGYFENNYDCSSTRYDYVKEDTVNSTFFSSFDITSYNIGDPYYADPCEGSYPCTKTGPEITSSTRLIQKNAQVVSQNGSPTAVFGGEKYAGGYFGYSLWNWDYILNLYFQNCTIPYSEATQDPGSYQNYFLYLDEYTTDPIPVCGSTGVVIAQGTSFDVVAVFRFSGSSTYSATFDYQPESSPGANDGYAYVSKKEWVHSRKHDIHLYSCDSVAGTMTDISGSGLLDLPMPFYYPWSNDNLSQSTTWGYCGGDLRYPGWIMGFEGGTNNYYKPYNAGTTTNAIVGTLQQGSPSTVYGVEVSGVGGGGYNGSVITESFSGALGNSTITPVALPEFFPLPDLTSNITASTWLTCNDTIGQSGCNNNLGGGIWHSGTNCANYDCNPCASGGDCKYCRTVWGATPAYEDWGVRTVSGAASITYSSTDVNDPLNGSYDPNGTYYPWFDDTGHMWYGKDHTDETIVGNPIGTGIYFVLSPNAPFIGNNDIKIAKSPYDFLENMWTNGDGASHFCYGGSASYSGHIASTGTSVVVGGETITLTPASITDPIVTISYPTINSSTNKTVCETSSGVFLPVGWNPGGWNGLSACEIYSRVPLATNCSQSTYIGGDYQATPIWESSDIGFCCGTTCYPPAYITGGCFQASCPP
jgi:hypothetical protein